MNLNRDYAIYMLDAQGHVTTWNADAERIKGYRANEAIGRFFGQFFIPEEVLEGVPERELELAAREGLFEIEAWRQRKDGSRFWASVLLTAIRNEANELIGFAKVMRDLTHVRRQQDLLQRVTELAPCGMLLVDSHGQIEMVNAETERIFGYPRNELLGQPLEILLPMRSRHGHVGLRQGFLKMASTRVMGVGQDLYGLRKGGEEFPVEIGLSPIESSDGISTLATIFDITARRLQQQETERALAEKETLLREVYHRVKNNLQVVQSLLTLQRQTLPEGPAREALQETVQRVRAMALVHEKLYQSGNLAAVSLAVYVRDLIKQIGEAHSGDNRSVRMTSNIPPIETGLDNAVPFGLLLTELISNCMKHAFPRRLSGEIRVSVVRHENGDLLTVEDNGVGFPAGFDPNETTATMGLQLASGLARQLGGRLTAATASGAVVSALLRRL